MKSLTVFLLSVWICWESDFAYSNPEEELCLCKEDEQTSRVQGDHLSNPGRTGESEVKQGTASSLAVTISAILARDSGQPKDEFTIYSEKLALTLSQIETSALERVFGSKAGSLR